MFGYIKIDKPELKIKDYEVYHTVYCSLCKTLGRRFGVWARLTLNYDFTFFALLRLSLTKECPAFKASRCTFNPLIKCGKCVEGGGVFDLTAAAAGWLLYFKMLDAARDQHGLKKSCSRLLAPLLHRTARRGEEEFPQLEPLLQKMNEAQAQVERQETVLLDEAAHPTAQMLGGLFALGEPEEEKRRILERLGYCLGRYVYFMDAADDREKDLKSGNFNPFVRSYEITRENVNDPEILGRMEEVIRMSANEALCAFYLLKTERYGDIIENILKNGLHKGMLQILYHKNDAKVV